MAESPGEFRHAAQEDPACSVVPPDAADPTLVSPSTPGLEGFPMLAASGSSEALPSPQGMSPGGKGTSEIAGGIQVTAPRDEGQRRASRTSGPFGDSSSEVISTSPHLAPSKMQGQWSFGNSRSASPNMLRSGSPNMMSGAASGRVQRSDSMLSTRSVQKLASPVAALENSGSSGHRSSLDGMSSESDGESLEASQAESGTPDGSPKPKRKRTKMSKAPREKDAAGLIVISEKRELFFFLFEGFPDNATAGSGWITASQIIGNITLGFVVLTCIILALESLRGPHQHHISLFILETLAITWFVIEYSTRFILVKKKWAFFRKPLNLVDVFTIIPYFLDLSGASNLSWLSFLRVVRLVRVMRIFKMTRRSGALKDIMATVKGANMAVSLLLFLMTIALLIMSSVMYMVEQFNQEWSPQERLWIRQDGSSSPFQSIFHTMWWCISTITTVGYGDDVPVTLPGKLAGGVTMMAGILVIAFPTVILSGAFHEAFTDRTTRATLGMLARRQLDMAEEAAAIARMEAEREEAAIGDESELLGEGEEPPPTPMSTLKKGHVYKDGKVARFIWKFMTFMEGGQIEETDRTVRPEFRIASRANSIIPSTLHSTGGSRVVASSPSVLASADPYKAMEAHEKAKQKQHQTPLQSQHSSESLDHTTKEAESPEVSRSNSSAASSGAGVQDPLVAKDATRPEAEDLAVPRDVFSPPGISVTFSQREPDEKKKAVSAADEAEGGFGGSKKPDQTSAGMVASLVNHNVNIMQGKVMLIGENSIAYAPAFHFRTLPGTDMIKGSAEPLYPEGFQVTLRLVMDSEEHRANMLDLARETLDPRITTARVQRMHKLRIDLALPEPEEIAARCHLLPMDYALLKMVRLSMNNYNNVVNASIPVILLCPTESSFLVLQKCIQHLRFSFKVEFQPPRVMTIDCKNLKVPRVVRHNHMMLAGGNAEGAALGASVNPGAVSGRSLNRTVSAASMNKSGLREAASSVNLGGMQYDGILKATKSTGDLRKGSPGNRNVVFSTDMMGRNGALGIRSASPASGGNSPGWAGGPSSNLSLGGAGERRESMGFKAFQCMSNLKQEMPGVNAPDRDRSESPGNY